MQKIAVTAFIFIILSLNLVIMVQAENAITQPIIPEFTLKYLDNSYDILPIRSTDPYTGKSVLTQVGYNVENKSVEVIIKNQQFPYYYNENGSFVGLYYNIRYKGHFETYWHQVKADTIYYLPHYLPSSYAEYTFDYFGVGDDYYLNVTTGGQVDFQVMTFIGYYQKVSDGMTPLGEDYHYEFVGQSTDWSNTQTITIGYNSSTSASSPLPSVTNSPSDSFTQNPTSTQLPSGNSSSLIVNSLEAVIAVLLIVVVVLLVFVMFYLRRRGVGRQSI